MARFAWVKNIFELWKKQEVSSLALANNLETCAALLDYCLSDNVLSICIWLRV